jgi:hypothetical protein
MENGTRALAVLGADAIGADTDILGRMVDVTAADVAAGEKRNIAALA